MSDLKAACERLRRVTTGESIWKVYTGMSIGLYDVDMRHLADAYLAEHPADEDLAVDAAWLRDNCPNAVIVDDGFIGIELVAAWERGPVSIGTVVAIKTHTRGHVRRLIAALGLDSTSTSG